jgi:hypothetical protein
VGSLLVPRLNRRVEEGFSPLLRVDPLLRRFQTPVKYRWSLDNGVERIRKVFDYLGSSDSDSLIDL